MEVVQGRPLVLLWSAGRVRRDAAFEARRWSYGLGSRVGSGEGSEDNGRLSKNESLEHFFDLGMVGYLVQSEGGIGSLSFGSESDTLSSAG